MFGAVKRKKLCVWGDASERGTPWHLPLYLSCTYIFSAPAFKILAYADKFTVWLTYYSWVFLRGNSYIFYLKVASCELSFINLDLCSSFNNISQLWRKLYSANFDWKCFVSGWHAPYWVTVQIENTIISIFVSISAIE